ncbi:MAG: hypothetical protein ABW170_20745 [Candidatus Thiodiazotropha sp. L084R]
MKWLLTTLLIPGLALAQPPGSAEGQIDQQQYFDQSKQTMMSMINKSLPAMEETKTCLGKAGDQAAFTKCVEIMMALEKEMQAKMGHAAGMPDNPQAQAKQRKEVEFNEQNKSNMLKFLDQSILMGNTLKKCFSTSESPQQMQNCMTAAKPKA